ncbi:MAG TPA: RNA-directed DNA polymerase [Flavobacteriales bacterium]|nr:RNA-directed DNA polymerase [Flavobacteriales bacterium]
MKRILELNNLDAKKFFLKEESYFNFDLPKYFAFENLITKVSSHISESPIEDFYLNPPDYSKNNPKPQHPLPSDFDDTNYKLLNNKDGKFAWRPFQLIHPAIYASLVHVLTEEHNWRAIQQRFSEFSSNENIKCYSIPLQSDNFESDKAETVSQWWQSIEQQSIELALSFEYVLHTDITDCYGSIYTHSIPWAIHTKAIAKSQRNNQNLVGNKIDKHLRDMSFGQTNGIPQGSVLMDFFAELILGYADHELSTKINIENIKDYKIIRYRDDYRIFSNNPQVADHITKLLTEILIELGMRLNAHKTLVSNNVVKDAIKPDKIYWTITNKTGIGVHEQLLLTHNLAENYPNSGSLNKALNRFFRRIKGINSTKQNIPVLTSIIVDIMYKNPRTYPISSAILSKLLSLLPNDKREEILKIIYARFDKIPNTGHIKIWLQRLTIKIDRLRNYHEKLCQKVNDANIQIWNSDWLNPTLKSLIETTSIVSNSIIDEIDVIIEIKEVELFKSNYDYVTSEIAPA